MAAEAKTGKRLGSLSFAGRIALAGMLSFGAATMSGHPPPAFAMQAEAGDNPEVIESANAVSEQQAVAGMEDFADYGLVGFESVELNAHTNSNIAAGHLEANGQTFGTNGVKEPETSLIGSTDSQLAQVTTDNGSRVIFGNAQVEDADAENAKYVDRAKVTANGGDADSISSGATPDFGEWQGQAAETSRDLASLRDSAVFDGSDMNDRRIVSSNPQGITSLTVSAADLSRHSTEVRTEQLTGTLVVNIDAAGNSSLALPPFIVNGRSNAELTEWSDHNAILNIVDSTAEDGMFRGTATFTGRVIGIVMAPLAEIVANHNVDGQIIANRITVNGEFHRDSYVGGETGGAPGDTPEVPPTLVPEDVPSQPGEPDDVEPDDTPGQPGSENSGSAESGGGAAPAEPAPSDTDTSPHQEPDEGANTAEEREGGLSLDTAEAGIALPSPAQVAEIETSGLAETADVAPIVPISIASALALGAAALATRRSLNSDESEVSDE